MINDSASSGRTNVAVSVKGSCQEEVISECYYSSTQGANLVLLYTDVFNFIFKIKPKIIRDTLF